MTARSYIGLRVAIGLTVTGLLCLAPVLFSLGPVTLGLFMAGALLVVAGVVASAVLLPRSIRAGRRSGAEPGSPP